MAIPPLASLLNALTPAQITAALLNFLASAGLPSTAWAPVSVPTLMVESNAKVLSALQQQIVNLGYGGYFQLASQPQLQTGPGGTSPWVDLGAQQFYNQLRRQPQSAIGPFSFGIVSGAGPYSIRAGQLKITDAVGNIFTNQTPFTLTGASGATSVVATVMAQTPGSAANIANGTQLTLATSLAGVTVTTFPASGSPPWYTSASADTGQAQAGTNIESDNSLISRCINQWSALGTGSPVGAWINWVFAASNEVRYCAVQATGLGSVRVIVWGNDGDISDAGLAAITSYLTPRIPVCSFLAPGFPRNSVEMQVNPTVLAGNYAALSLTLYGPASAQSSAVAAAITALELLVQTTPLGGYAIGPGTPDVFGVSNALIIEAVMNANSALTKVVASVTNYLDSVAQSPSGAGADLIMTPATSAGGPVPVALQGPDHQTSSGTSSWNITYVPV